MELEKRLLSMIVRRLYLDEIDSETYDYSAPLFSSNEESVLELESVDSLEVIVGLKQEFNIFVGENDRKALYSIDSIAEFARNKEPEKKGFPRFQREQ